MTSAGPTPQVVFVAGLSGSGKSTAMAALEDLSFYGIDSLPPQLVSQFLDLCAKATPPIAKIALAVDAREQRFLENFPSLIAQLRDAGTAVDVIFLECSDEVLINRYRETRRVHPLSPTGSVEEGIRRERELLGAFAQLADLALDTSHMNVHQLKETVVRRIAGGARQTIVRLQSFGFRYGPPGAAELLFDVRFLANPYFEPELRAGAGTDPKVAAFVLENDRAREFVKRLLDLLDFALPNYDEEGKAYLTIGVGCTGGRHRSVAVVEHLGQLLRERGREVNVDHRDMERRS